MRSFLKGILSWLRGDRAKHRRGARYFRPQVESLEDRRVPATFAVTTADNDAPGGLAEALASARQDTEISHINISPTLAGATITVHETLNMDGPGRTIQINAPSGGVTIAAGEGRSAFEYSPVVVTAGTTAVLNNLRITGGFSPVGAAVFNDGDLTVNNGAMFGNRAVHFVSENFENIGGGRGGAVYNNGQLTLRNTEIHGNVGDEEGGGIYLDHGRIFLFNSTIHDNTAKIGGGIRNLHGDIINTGSLVFNNVGGDFFPPGGGPSP